MSAIKPANVILGGVLASAFLAFALYFHLLLPPMSRAASLKTELAAEESALRKASSDAAWIAKTGERVRADREEVLRLGRQVGSLGKDVLSNDDLLFYLDGGALSSADRQKAELRKVLLSEERIGRYLKQRWSLSLTADHGALMEYLHSLETISAFNSVSNVALTASTGTLDVRETAEIVLETVSQAERSGTPLKDRFTPRSPEVPRDPFLYVVRAANPSTQNGLQLTGFIYRAKDQFAVINGAPYQAGDELPGGMTVRKMGDRQVVVGRPGQADILLAV